MAYTAFLITTSLTNFDFPVAHKIRKKLIPVWSIIILELHLARVLVASCFHEAIIDQLYVEPRLQAAF